MRKIASSAEYRQTVSNNHHETKRPLEGLCRYGYIYSTITLQILPVLHSKTDQMLPFIFLNVDA